MLLSLLVFFFGLGTISGLRGPHHPTGHVHHHAKPVKDSSLTDNANILHDIEHLKEDLGPMAESVDFASMSKEDMDWYYFKLHDTDNNGKLDGLEILYGFVHIYEEDDKSSTEPKQENSLDFLEGIVDNTLAAHDSNKNGFIEYEEFRQKSE